MIKPYDWQEPAVVQGATVLPTTNLILNCAQTGLGKTIIAIETMKRLNRRFLVIAPLAVHTSWKRTAAEMDAEHLLFGVVNPERLQYKNSYYVNKKWVIPKGVTIVWDEVHKGASGIKSKTTKILASTKAYGIPVMAMSATIADSPLKLRGLGYLAGLHDFTNVGYYGWCLKHGCFLLPGTRSLQFTKSAAGKKYMQSIHEKIKHMLIRLKTTDAPDFPEGLVVPKLFDLDAKYQEEINKIYSELEDYLKISPANALTEMLRARQRVELFKVPLLTDLVTESLEDDESPVVFINFRETLATLSEALTAKGIPFESIYGGQKPGDRDEAIRRFKDDETFVMLAMTQAGGIGINLHGLPGQRIRCSYLCPNFNASEFIQNLGRIHRSGGTNVVQTIVLAANTIEERIAKSIKQKVLNIETLNDGDLI